MIWTSEQLAKGHAYEDASVEDLIETMNATGDIWTLYLVVQGLDRKYWQSWPKDDHDCGGEIKDKGNPVFRQLEDQARQKLSDECWRQFRTMWNYRTLNGTFTCVPRLINGYEKLLDKISRRMRQIEWMSIWLATWSPTELAHMATISGPWSSWQALAAAERKLIILNVLCPWCCRGVVGPAAKIKR